MTSKTKMVNRSSKDILTCLPNPLHLIMKFSSTKDLNKVSIRSAAQSHKANQVRTHLLLLLNSECNRLIKEQKSMVNHRTFAESEKEFCNDYIFIHLKPVVYSAPLYGNEVGRLRMITSTKNNFIFTSPICYGKYCPPSCIQCPCTLRKRETLGRKKLDHFKKTYLNGLCNIEMPTKQSPRKSVESFKFEDRLELINVEQGFARNKKTQLRVEQGFAYLQKLCSELKNDVENFKKKSVCSLTGDIYLNNSNEISLEGIRPQQEGEVPLKRNTISTLDEIESQGAYNKRGLSVAIVKNKKFLSKPGIEERRTMDVIQQNRSNQRHHTNYEYARSKLNEEEFSVVKLRQCKES